MQTWFCLVSQTLILKIIYFVTVLRRLVEEISNCNSQATVGVQPWWANYKASSSPAAETVAADNLLKERPYQKMKSIFPKILTKTNILGLLLLGITSDKLFNFNNFFQCIHFTSV